MKKIGDQAFSRCGCLQSVSFGRRMGVVGSKALYQDHSVKKVVFLGKLLKKIGKKAFWGVPKSVRITVPKSKAKQYKKLIRRSK